MKGKNIKKFYKSRLFNFLAITILGVGILFNIIYASSAISQKTNLSYLGNHPLINHNARDIVPYCGNNVCDYNYGENPTNCVEDCFVP